jgi:hypothetical protein
MQRFKVIRNAVDLKGSETSQSQAAPQVTVATRGRVVAP